MKEATICDDILHVNMFHYFKTPMLYVCFLQNLSTMNVLDLILYCMVFLRFLRMLPPPQDPQ